MSARASGVARLIARMFVGIAACMAVVPGAREQLRRDGTA